MRAASVKKGKPWSSFSFIKRSWSGSARYQLKLMMDQHCCAKGHEKKRCYVFFNISAAHGCSDVFFATLP